MHFCTKTIKKAAGKVDSQGVAHRQKQGTTGYACACTGYALPHAFFKDTTNPH